MRNHLRKLHLFVIIFPVWLASSAVAQEQAQPQSPGSFNVTHVIGLEGIKHETKGKVTVSKDGLEFATGPTRSSVSIASIQDVLTGADSQRAIGGTIGFLSGFAPYEGGRFLSLFRVKLDTLTIQYRDSDGGLHGVIFTLQEGQSAALKSQLVAQGAKTSISVEEEAKQKAEAKKAKEKKP
jgi:hypothetical protein